MADKETTDSPAVSIETVDDGIERYPGGRIKSVPARMNKHISAPPSTRLMFADMVDKDGLPDMELVQKHLHAEGRIDQSAFITLCSRVSDVLRAEPTLMELAQPITICGDIHGQYYDLLRLFEVGGPPAAGTRYLFLGDYVDRGYFSAEVVIHMFCLKLRYPGQIFMLRGNHECRHLSSYFTFEDECKKKYSIDVYNAVMNAFDTLPLAAVVDGRFLCVHGGLSPNIVTLDDIRKVDRFREPPQSGVMCDLLWADPMEEFGPHVEDTFKYNDTRGCSYFYGYRAVCDFLKRNKLLSVIRAHEAQDDGHKMHCTNEETKFPAVITLFSAPNYLDCYHNKGAVLVYSETLMNIRQFTETEHPYWLPNFMDVFTWSLPFVAEKIAELLVILLKLVDDEEEEEETAAIEAHNVAEAEALEAKRNAVRRKILAMGRMAMMMRTLREERENVLKLKGLSDGKLPPGILTAGAAAIEKAVTEFDEARQADRPNEKRPPLKDSQEFNKLKERQGSLLDRMALIQAKAAVKAEKDYDKDKDGGGKEKKEKSSKKKSKKEKSSKKSSSKEAAKA